MTTPKKTKNNTVSWQITVTEYYLSVHSGRSIPLPPQTKGLEIDMMTLIGTSKPGVTPEKCNFTLRFYSDGTTIPEPKRELPNASGTANGTMSFNHVQLQEILLMLANPDAEVHASYGAKVNDPNDASKDTERYASVGFITKRHVARNFKVTGLLET